MGKTLISICVALLGSASVAFAEDKAGIALLSDTKITETAVEAPAAWQDKQNTEELQGEIEKQATANDTLRERVEELEKAVEEKGLSTKEISKQIKELERQMAELQQQKAQ